MFTQAMKRVVIVTVAAVGTLAAGTFSYPIPAHADDPCTGDPSCPHFAHLVCEQVDGGSSSGQVTEITAVAYNITKDYAAWLVSGAIAAYCPWDKGK
jgi:Protein of unknown function (DUF732)